MIANRAMTDDMIGERAEARRRRGRYMLTGVAILAALVLLVTAWLRNGDLVIPAPVSIALAAGVAALMLYFFRADRRTSDEVERAQADRVMAGAVKDTMSVFPAWLILQQANLVPELSAVGLLAFLTAMMLLRMTLGHLRG